MKIDEDAGNEIAYFSSINEFVLGAPCLSFATLSIKKYGKIRDLFVQVAMHMSEKVMLFL